MADDLAWVEAPGGYALALEEGKLICRNAAGKVLSSVPKQVREGEAAAKLLQLSEWLEEHERECAGAVEGWMSRSLPVPRPVVESTWADPAWRTSLENAIVRPLDGKGRPDPRRIGFLKGVDRKKGVGLVGLDGETAWIGAPALAIPHPILIEDLDGFRELATELQFSQGLSQLFRETWSKTNSIAPDATSIDRWQGGEFAMLAHAVGRARSQGFRVRGGYSVCPIREADRTVEARYWIGAEIEMETTTGELLWVDRQEQPLPLAEVGPVAFSEGMRMASLIYAGRKTEEEGGEN